MRYAVLASDYDGTLAHDGLVNERTLASLKKLRESGRKLLLVKGRRLDDLFATFEHTGEFDLVVAENGARRYEPSTREQQVLAEPPPDEFLARLAEAGVHPLEHGRVIIATLDYQKQRVVETI